MNKDKDEFIKAYNRCSAELQNILTKNFKSFVDKTVGNALLRTPMITGYIIRCAEKKLKENFIINADEDVKEILKSKATQLKKLEEIANFLDKHEKIGIGEITKPYCLLSFDEVNSYLTIYMEDYINSVFKKIPMTKEKQDIFYELSFRNGAFGYIYKIAEDLVFKN